VNEVNDKFKQWAPAVAPSLSRIANATNRINVVEQFKNKGDG